MIAHPVDVPVANAPGVVVVGGFERRLSHNPDFFVAGHFLVGLLWANLAVGWWIDGEPLIAWSVVTTESHLLTVDYPLSYPLWWPTAEQGCFIWLYGVDDGTRSLEPPWDE